MISVVKRSGEKVPLDITKIQRQVAHACRGIDGVSPSMIEIAAKIQFHDGMTTEIIDELLLKAMVDLIDETVNPETNNVNYQYVAGRQKVSMLRKSVYGEYDPPRLYEIVKKNVDLGMYTTELLDWYTQDEWDIIDLFVDHTKDENYSYSAITQLADKYLVQNRTNGTIYETPQVRYAIAAATAFHAEPKEKRLKFVKDYYECASDGLFTLATPVLAGLGTPNKQFSSCVLITVDDTLDSIFASGEIMAKYGARRAGIGLEIGKIRPLGAPIRNGEISHTGLLPFLKKWYGDLRSCCLRIDSIVEVLKDGVPTKIKIIQVKPGMMIKSIDDAGNNTYNEVEKVFPTRVNQPSQVWLKFENETGLNCSEDHPIMVKKDGAITAVLPGDLTTEDDIITENGTTKLTEYVLGQGNDPIYIDITVKDTHLFFAADNRDGEMILTHNSQGGIRNSSCTVHLPVWHYQFEDFIVLKNNQGTEETRVRQMDYSVVMSSLFWKRFKESGNITLFDPHEVPDLYEAYYSDIKKFEELYIKYENDPSIKKKVRTADQIIKEGLLKERMDTGRIYVMNIDNVINHTPFDVSIDPIYQSNLCQEVLISSKPLQRIEPKKKIIRIKKSKVQDFMKNKSTDIISVRKIK